MTTAMIPLISVAVALGILVFLSLRNMPELPLIALVVLQPFKQYLLTSVPVFSILNPTAVVILWLMLVVVTTAFRFRLRVAFPPGMLLIQSIFVSWILLSLLWTPAPEYGTYKAMRFLFINSPVLFAPMIILNSQRSIKRITWIIAIFAVLVYAKIMLWPSYSYSVLGEDKFFRAGLLYGADAAPVALQFGSTFLIAVLFLAREKLTRIFAAASVVVLMGGAWFTGTRAPVVAVLSSVILAIWVVVRKKRLVYATFAAVGAVLVLGAAEFLSPVPQRTRMFAGLTSIDASGTARLDHWTSAIQAFLLNPLGLGIGGYAHYDLGLDARWFPHSIVLETMAELGLPGILMLAGLFYVFARYVFRARRKLFKDKAGQSLYGDAWLLGTFASSMVGLLSDDLADNRTIWLGMGITVAAYQLSLRNPTRAARPESSFLGLARGKPLPALFRR